MSSRFVNLALFIDTIALLATGILLFTTNRAADAWLYDVHRYAGAALVVLLIPKTRIVWRAFARHWRRGTWLSPNALVGALLTGFLLVSLALALAWTLNALPFYLDLVVIYITPIELHWYFGLAVVPFFIWHAIKRWVPFPRPLVNLAPGRPVIGRRAALSLLGVGLLGLVGFGALDALAAATPWMRRFTGSRFVNSFAGNDFPVTSSDGEPEINLGTWRLRISGLVAQPIEWTYNELLALPSSARTATVDCTLGWASTQDWRGVSIAALLERAGASSQAREVTCRAETGYSAALTIEEARDALVATHIGSVALAPAHGFPARLVAPSRRGYHWIKWMNEIVVS